MTGLRAWTERFVVQCSGGFVQLRLTGTLEKGRVFEVVCMSSSFARGFVSTLRRRMVRSYFC